MKTIIIATTTLIATAGASLAFQTNPTAVPEISALEGTAALAAVAAVVLMAWERRRKA